MLFTRPEQSQWPVLMSCIAVFYSGCSLRIFRSLAERPPPPEIDHKITFSAHDLSIRGLD
ncbi:uncharacterized protein EI97DRAFT_437385 [Westerdykella ornata]|uniref:Uncharacterized protein n=1 Tax=Westerdykella ornata TaxID=318751 RepID=A0A6A6J5N1_WESOR|nr:uncharacterized protein EI97DRAFT_437385 [Westerdykella ornata]KAF2271900.1 hypothetical protein EI97DRAFT_437385 [Westerdykella ornata]